MPDLQIEEKLECIWISGTLESHLRHSKMINCKDFDTCPVIFCYSNEFFKINTKKVYIFKKSKLKVYDTLIFENKLKLELELVEMRGLIVVGDWSKNSSFQLAAFS